jgi:hypothetical protein
MLQLQARRDALHYVKTAAVARADLRPCRLTEADPW